MPNPFKPTAGMTPPVLVGRQVELDDFQIALDDGVGAPGRLLYVTGARGVGKTVMLNALGDIARNRGWYVIDETAEVGFLSRLILELLDRPETRISKYELPSGGFAVPGAGIQASLGFGSVEFQQDNQVLDIRHAIVNRLDRLKESEQGVLITLDEVQPSSLPEIRSLAIGIQHLIREKRNVAFVFAGLPSMVDTVINDDVLTFLRRAECHHLGSVDLKEIWSAFEKTISKCGKNANYDVLNSLTEATNGYPFMIQLVGYWSWRYSDVNNHLDRVHMEDAQQGIKKARISLGSMVHGPEFDNLSPMAKDYLIAMSQDDGPSNTRVIAERIHRDVKYASVYRAQLIKEDVIEQTGFGYVDFKIPYLRDYLKEHAVHHQMKKDIAKAQTED